MRAILLVGAFIMLMACGGPPLPADPPNRAEARESLSRGNYWYERGCYPEAERFFHEALSAARLSDDVPLIVRAGNSLGTAALAAGDLSLAAAFLEQALELSVAAEGRPLLDIIMGNLGSLAFKAKNSADAEDFWLKALEIAEDRGASPAIHLCNLARLALNRKDPRFQSLAARALAAARTASGEALADALNLGGHAELALGNEAGAEEYFQEALSLDRKSENRSGLAQDTEALGLLRLSQQRPREAAGFFDRAFFLMAAAGDYEGRDRLYAALEKLSLEEGFPKKMDAYDRARRNPDDFSALSRCP